MLYDKDIREPLFEFLEERYGKVRIIEEKQTGKSRADVVMVRPSLLCGVEIKSDADTYARLARQVKDYDKYYDLNYVVVGTSHAMHIEEHVPQYWGIITVEAVDQQIDFYVLREADVNPNVKWEDKITILWRPELAHIQELNEMPQYKQKSKAFVQEKILQKIDAEVLQTQMCDALFERDYTAIWDEINAFRVENGQKKRRRLAKRKRRKRGS